jgi:DNA-binding NtrC family response regulator
VLGQGDGVIRADDLPEKVRARATGVVSDGWLTPPWDFGTQGIDFYREMEWIEDRIIARALDISGGNKKEAARLLHLNRTTLLEKLKRKREAGRMDLELMARTVRGTHADVSTEIGVAVNAAAAEPAPPVPQV